jgi:hypothetical protein
MDFEQALSTRTWWPMLVFVQNQPEAMTVLGHVP